MYQFGFCLKYHLLVLMTKETEKESLQMYCGSHVNFCQTHEATQTKYSLKIFLFFLWNLEILAPVSIF